MRWRSALILWLLLMLLPFLSMASPWLEVSEEAASLFPSATRMKASEDALPVTEIYQLDQPIGYVFETDNLTNFPGFSGDTINLRVGLDTEGRIVGLLLLGHHEPIFLHGLGYHRFRHTARRRGRRAAGTFIRAFYASPAGGQL